MSEATVNIMARMRMRQAAKAKQEAFALGQQMMRIDTEGRVALEDIKNTINLNLGPTLRFLTLIQLTRFAFRDLQDLASGRGGFGDMISLAVSMTLLMFQLRETLKTNVALATTLRLLALQVGGTALAAAATHPIALFAGALGVIAGAVYLYQEPSLRAQMMEQRLHLQAARAVGVQ